jgi:uncharacterized protein (TIGR02145 family)
MKKIFRIYQIIGLILVFTSSCELEKPASLPELTTLPLSDITSISATGGGSVSWNGGATITSRGVCWSTNFNPTISDNTTTDGVGEGSFTSSLTGLTSGTDYYIRAYATNSAGTAYGNKIIFTTPLTDVDGNIYYTTRIGDQVWITENLRTTKLNDKTSISNITDNSIWSTLSTPAYSWYRNQETVDDQKYGVLYNWFTINTGKLCPAGWHVPDEEEWSVLTEYLGGEWEAGGKLKEQGLVHWISPNTGALNIFGFTALPAGYRTGLSSGTFRAKGYIGWWWSSTEVDAIWARNRTLAYDAMEIARGQGLKKNGYSVRCLKD